MNDSLRTDVFVRFQPESIACACIYLAARTLEVSALLHGMALSTCGDICLPAKLLNLPELLAAAGCS